MKAKDHADGDLWFGNNRAWERKDGEWIELDDSQGNPAIRFSGEYRKRIIIDIAQADIAQGKSKTATITRMKEINRDKCCPPLLMKDMPTYYAEAKKKAAMQSSPVLDCMEAEAAAGQALSSTDADKVAHVITLAQELYAVDRDIARLNAQLKPLMDRQSELVSKEVPEAMKEAGVGDEFPLANGWKVRRASRMTASLPTPNAIDRERDPDAKAALISRLEAGLNFLTETGNQGIIKDQFQINLAKGETNRAKGIENFLRKRNIPFAHNKTVHSQTLGAFVREQIAEGKDLPMDVFGVYEAVTVKLVPPKDK